MNHYIFWTVVLGLSFTSQALTLNEALEIARKNSPSLRASRAYEQAASRSVEAAGLWSNPELDFEGEGLGGDNAAFDQGEYAVSLKQVIPLGGQSRNQRAVAQQAAEVTIHATSEAGLDLDSQVRVVFAEALAQQEIAKVRDEQEKLSRDFIAVTTDRHAMGGASEMELVQADLALEEVLLEKQCCFGDLDVAKKDLASLLGVGIDEVGTPAGDFYKLESSVPFTVNATHPVLLRLRAQEAQVRSEAALVKSQSFGDLKLGAGVKYEAADEAHSFVVSAMIPLPIRKKGRLEYAAASLRADALSAQYEEAQRNLQQQLNKIVQVYQRTAEEASQYKTRMLPMAEKAYELSRQGYDAGRYSWMELLAAQQNLAGLRVRYVEALLAAHKASAELNQFKKGE